MAHEPVEMQKLLKQVSRSFYLTLRILPPSIRKPVSIAYLLARASDTVADTKLIAVSRRREALQQLRESIRQACRGEKITVPEFGDLASAQDVVTGEGNAGERILLQQPAGLLHAYGEVEREDRFRISKLLATITTGQESDLIRFDLTPGGLEAFNTDTELDEYTYAVAGCVGEFWTEMCRTHVFPEATLDNKTLLSNGIRFGKGLQLVNILRDIPNDLQRGRCYIPRDRLAGFGLSPGDLLDSAAMDRFRPLYEGYLDRASDHLAAGWRYTISLPFRCIRIRLACAWPVLIGIRTLDQLRGANVLDRRFRIKIRRAEIRQLIVRSLLLYPLPSAWNRLGPQTIATDTPQ